MHHLSAAAEAAADGAGHPYDTDTQVEPIAGVEGAFAATISERWNALGGTANGGYLLAVCLQALRRTMPFPDPLVASAFYLRPGLPGPAEVRTELVRNGRRTATGEARLLRSGVEVVRALATFADLRQPVGSGRTLVLNRKPGLPPPAELPDLLGGGSLPGVSITEMVEYRMAKPPGWLRGQPSGDPSAELWLRFRGGREPDLLSLALLSDAAAPVVLELGETGSATLELTVHLRAHPAPGWLACRAQTRYVLGGYHEEDFELWDSAGRLVAQSRQLALLPGSPARG